MNYKIRNILFLFISVFLIFNNIPKVIQQNNIGGALLDKLVFYPIFIGLIYTLYCQCKYKNILVNFDKFLKFIIVYLVVNCACLIIGLYNYPYYELIQNHPISHIEKLSVIINCLNSFGIYIEDDLLIIISMFLARIKGIFLDALYTFGGAYMIYCWYYNNWKMAFKILIKGILISVFIIFCYSTLELFYFTGEEWAKNILIIITPYFHSIDVSGSAWENWPPILPPGKQLRSIFAEPSYFGIFAAFCIPFLWYCINNMKDKIIYTIVFFIIVFFVFLSQARTATSLLFGEVGLLFLSLVYFRDKLVIKTVFLVCLSISVAFFSANYFLDNFVDNTSKNGKVENYLDNTSKNGKVESYLDNTSRNGKVESYLDNTSKNGKVENYLDNTSKNGKVESYLDNTSKNGKVESYLDKNFYSVFSDNKRSNSARYAYIKSAFRVGFDNPVFGVGRGLTAAYMNDYFTAEEIKVQEIQLRLKRQQELGIFNAGMPILCEYASKFAETGIVGCIVYFAPLLYLLHRLLKKLRNLQYEYLFYMISLAGMLASGFSLELTGSYYYWVLLGLGYAMCFSKEKEEQKV